MRRANVQLAADRRSEILAAAQTCFARSGFHHSINLPTQNAIVRAGHAYIGDVSGAFGKNALVRATYAA